MIFLITVKAPGKLYIAGEYAVVEPGNPAILIAVDQFIRVQASFNPSISTARSEQSPGCELRWHSQDGTIHFEALDQRFSYVAAAIKTTEQYLTAHGYNISNYNLNISSELDSQNGRKYGLGSSAAVTVAVVKAICRLMNCPVDLMTTFKLAAIAHLNVQGNGSLGDVAASVYQGWIAYQSFDRNWLLAALQNNDVATVVAMDWRYLRIERLTPPVDLRVLIGWTGTPASTANLLGKVTTKQIATAPFYHHFLSASHECVEQMITAFKNHDLGAIQTQLIQNRKLLVDLANRTGIEIETPALTKLCNIVIDHGGAAKSSGAGGGDCGIAIINKHAPVQPIIEQWQQASISKLALTISNNQQEETNDQPSFTS